jgi:hypothetical protein
VDVSKETVLELFRRTHAAQERFVYFFLTGAGSSIVLVLTRTPDGPVDIHSLPAAAAVLGWGLSFYMGCRQLLWSLATARANHHYLEAEMGLSELVVRFPDKQKEIVKELRRIVEEDAEKANRMFQWQYKVFILGSALYVLGNMWQRMSRLW